MSTLMRKEVFADVLAELDRQEHKWGVQDHPAIIPVLADSAGYGSVLRALEKDLKELCQEAATLGQTNWKNILDEEVAEACVAAFDDPLSDATRNELVQVAAVAISWIESIDRARARATPEEA